MLFTLELRHQLRVREQEDVRERNSEVSAVNVNALALVRNEHVLALGTVYFDSTRRERLVLPDRENALIVACVEWTSSKVT